MKEISDAVLKKVTDEARKIVKDAEESAAGEIEKGRRLQRERLEAETKRLLAEAENEAVRIRAQGRMAARNKKAAARVAVIDDIIARARKELEKVPARRECLERLIEEALAGLGKPGQVIVGVAKRDLELAREVVAGSESISGKVKEVAERPMEGGVVVESESGSVAVDNSHAARLEMLIPRIMPRLAKELF